MCRLPVILGTSSFTLSPFIWRSCFESFCFKRPHFKKLTFKFHTVLAGLPVPGQLDGRRKKIGSHQSFLLEKIPPHFCPSGICLKRSNESTSYIWPRHFSSSFSMWWLEISEFVHEPFRSGVLVFLSSSALPSGSPAGSQARCQRGWSPWWRSSVLRSRVWGSNTLLCRVNHSGDIPPTPHIVAIGWEETMSLPLRPPERVLFLTASLTCVQSLSQVWV